MGQASSFCDGACHAGASDDIRRATELAYRAVSEFGLSSVVGPLAVASMGGGDEGSLMLRDSGEPFSIVFFFGGVLEHELAAFAVIFCEDASSPAFDNPGCMAQSMPSRDRKPE